MKRYPFDALEVCILASARERLDGAGHRVAASRHVAGALGTSLQQVYRWRKIGVTADQADTLAVRVGLHSFEVWPELVDDGIEAAGRPCAFCGRSFMPSGRRRYCSDRCRWNRYARQVRSTPEGAARNRAARLQYYYENTAYESTVRRRYYRANRRRLLQAQAERDRARRPATRTGTSTQMVSSIEGHRTVQCCEESVVARSDDAVA